MSVMMTVHLAVEVEHESGKFISKADVAQAVADELDSRTIYVGDDSVYQVTISEPTGED